MPTYEYHCKKCGKDFEFFQSMKDAPLKTCPADACPEGEKGQGEVVRRISGGAGLLFKGSGFYITDYRSDSYKKGAEKEKPKPAEKSAEKKSSSSAPPQAS